LAEFASKFIVQPTPQKTAPKHMTDEDQAEDNTAEQTEEGVTSLEIRLDQFLQLCGVPTGGQAKMLIQSGAVLVNGEVETRRRKKLHVGDEVGLDGEIYDVAFEPDSEEQ
jgi:ribosome-associated protein